MNIVVTYPRWIEWERWVQHFNDNLKTEYIVSRIPNEVRKGDKCFILYDGFIRGYKYIDSIYEVEEFVYPLSKNYIPKGFSILMVGKFHEIENIPYRGFVGFRYTNFLFDGYLSWNFISEDERKEVNKYLEVLNA